MKRVFPYFFSLSVVLGLIYSCKKDKSDPVVTTTEDQIRMDLIPYYDAQELVLNQVYTTDEGYKIKFTTLKCYVENITNGSKVLKDVALYDFESNGTLLFNTTGMVSDFSQLSLNIGVQNSLNHNDPSTFPTNSALNIMNANDMHWDWNPGYIFVKIEAKADTIVDANEVFDLNVVFHMGLDVNLRSKQFGAINWIKTADHAYRANLRLDLLDFLRGDSNPIDLQSEYTSHSAPGQEAITTKIADNFIHALVH